MKVDNTKEQAYLTHTQQLARERITQLKASAEKNREDLFIKKQEMREEAKHAIGGNLWSADNFMQLVELSQYATQANEMLTKYEADMAEIQQLEKFIQSPYFARIDFTFDGEEEAQQIYIGRYAMMDEDTYAFMVYDWRSPISSIFYQFSLGKAYYDAPQGRITGNVELKRQYEINGGVLEYFFDTDIQILDEYLRKLLSQNASPQMKSIVGTIQRDQDLIIRNMNSDLLLVQGVAGSGKTSVALHRVAYLLYQGLTNKLRSNDIIVISPNLLFEQYISSVLPELGEDNITSLMLDEIFEMVLNPKTFQHKTDFYEALMEADPEPAAKTAGEGLRVKTGMGFINVLNQIELPKGLPLRDIKAFYRYLLTEEGLTPQFTACCEQPRDWAALGRQAVESLDGGFLYYDDAAVVVYLYIKSNGFSAYRHIKQVVIDEAQDYEPIHFEIFKLVFPNAKFTILGDFNQTILKKEESGFYETVQKVMGKKQSSLVHLDRSFRCAKEILDFSGQFLQAPLNSFSRHCDPPQIYQRENKADFKGLLEEIELCQGIGYQSIGILCKSAKDAAGLYGAIKEMTPVSLVRSSAEINLTGTLALPIYLGKGLEFDAVVVWDVDSNHYRAEEDKQLLYIACTRALHRLNLFYWGEPSPLVL